MKVFHFITHFDLGGAERVAANIAASPTPGIDYHVVEILRGRSSYTTKFIAELRSSGVRCHRSLVPDVQFHFLVERFAALLFPLRMLWLMLRWRPDVIHVHTETPDMCLHAFACLFPRLLRGVRVVRTVHNTRLWTGLPWLARHVEPFFQRLHANVAISPSVAEAYANRFGVMPPIVSNGVAEVEQTSYPALVSGKRNILFAGRFDRQKGVDVLCQVVSELAADSRYHFTIAGDGPLREEMSKSLHGLSNCSIVPPIYSLPSYLASFDALFMPSEFEGLGLMSVEASMCGLPVVANRCQGLCDTLPASWPLFVEGNSVEAYLHIFRHVLPSVSRASLAAEAHAFVMARFSIRLMQENYERIYSSSAL